MAKSRRKVDNQPVDLDLEDAPDAVLQVPELPEPVVKRKRGRPRKDTIVAPVINDPPPVTPQEPPPPPLPDPAIDADDVSKITEDSPEPSLPVAPAPVESPVVEAPPPVVEVPEEPKKEIAAVVSPRREKKPSKPVNPETERFWHIKRMR